jgi:hypothetical protein
MMSQLALFWCVFLLLAAEKKTPKTGPSYFVTTLAISFKTHHIANWSF